MAVQRFYPEPDPATFDFAACRAVLAVADEARKHPMVDPKDASTAARFIMGCYRAKDFIDPETFVVALIANLSRHPEATVKMAADPIDGIPRKFKFPPTICEVADELERLTEHLYMRAGMAAKVLRYEAVE